MARVLIADDHAVVRAGYRQFLESDPAITEIGEVASGNATLEALRLGHWDLVMLDIHMPDRGGLDILTHLRASYPDARVLVTSGLPEEQYARNVIRAGASGYLSKQSAPEELLRAVRTVLSGHKYVSATLAQLMVSDLDRHRPRARHSELSAREFQVLYKLANGASVTQIGRELSLSVKTVSTYRSRVLKKLALSTNAQITGYALRHGIIQ